MKEEAQLSQDQLDHHTADFLAKGGDVEEIETKSTSQIIADMKAKAQKGKWNQIETADLEARKQMKGNKK